MRKKTGPKHFRPVAFEKKLGEHCRKLRTKKGYGVNRMVAESDGLGASNILRLENAEGSVTVATLYRYAEVLEVPVKKLFDFDFHE